MIIPDFYKKQFSTKISILIIVSIFFIAGFVLNITSNTAAFNLDLNVVPYWQQNPVLGSHGFIIFMNIISNVFNPLICAGYILIFYLISHRKLQILVFLIWFIFLSFFLSILKQAIHQARPYWVPGNHIQTLQWNCYYQYGCPSGHSMMGLIIMEFILRFFARVHKCISKFQWAFFILVAALELCIMLSRVILGMHTFNQVLFGCMLGLFTFLPYYLYIQGFLTRIVLITFKNPRSPKIILSVIACICISILIETLLTLLPTYDNNPYIYEINKSQKCSQHYKPYKSFQYKCFQDSALIMAAFGIIIGLNVNNFSHRFAMLLDYTRLSVRFVVRFFVIIVMGLIPVAIFMNPLWQKINTTTQNLAIIIWACQNIAFFFGTFFLVVVAPLICDCLGLQTHTVPQNYNHFTKFQAYKMAQQMTDGPIFLGVRQTQMSQQTQVQNKRKVLKVKQ